MIGTTETLVLALEAGRDAKGDAMDYMQDERDEARAQLAEAEMELATQRKNMQLQVVVEKGA